MPTLEMMRYVQVVSYTKDRLTKTCFEYVTIQFN